MQNSVSVPPKDEGESNIPSGTIQSRKGLQNKSQFRTIAPKIVPKVLTSRMLPCHSPSRSDQVRCPGPLKRKLRFSFSCHLAQTSQRFINIVVKMS
ncbi:ZNF438 isoform 9 [Pan troglodytes]|uniref:Zinc finger protein 438 n=2 Tax=Homininae TaxID=207598 RepID=V9GYJ1_HUMAN|nr:zinc finger protein 438 [Homo sapiens]KAI4075606.1 zinc finger protein 438 [Homo sapiens]PNI60979.1 ZNF438 isoform 9 [Pan troglodytes]